MFRLEHRQNYEQYLLPGDIVFKYDYKHSDLSAKLIQFGQKINGSRDPTSVEYTHAGVYVGNKKYAEATHKTLGDLIASPTKGYFSVADELHIFRLKDREMAENLSNIMKIIVDDVPKEQKTGKTGSYSFTKALFSVLSAPRDSNKKLKGYLKSGYFAHAGIQPIKRGKHKDFFCSYLVSWAMQGAEARKTIDRFNQLNKEKIEFPDLSTVHEAERDQMLSQWAKGVIKKFGRQLEALIEIDLDAKTATPARLHDFIVENPQLFDIVGVVYTA